MFSVATNMVAELRQVELCRASGRHIISVTRMTWRLQNEVICKNFLSVFQKLFTRDPELDAAKFDTYLAYFPRLETAEEAGCRRVIKEEEIVKTFRSRQDSGDRWSTLRGVLEVVARVCSSAGTVEIAKCNFFRLSLLRVGQRIVLFNFCPLP